MLSAIIILIVLGTIITLLCMPWRPLTLRETALESIEIIGMIILFWGVTYLFSKVDFLEPLIKILHLSSVAMTCLGVLKIGLLLLMIRRKTPKAEEQ